MLHKAIRQFLEDVDWGELDYLLIDLPPGTGDVSMTLAQLLPQARFVIVTTPQPAAQKVAARAADTAPALRARDRRRDREHVRLHHPGRRALHDLRRGRRPAARRRARRAPARQDPAAGGAARGLGRGPAAGARRPGRARPPRRSSTPPAGLIAATPQELRRAPGALRPARCRRSPAPHCRWRRTVLRRRRQPWCGARSSSSRTRASRRCFRSSTRTWWPRSRPSSPPSRTATWATRACRHFEGWYEVMRSVRPAIADAEQVGEDRWSAPSTWFARSRHRRSNGPGAARRSATCARAGSTASASHATRDAALRGGRRAAADAVSSAARASRTPRRSACCCTTSTSSSRTLTPGARAASPSACASCSRGLTPPS